LLWVALVVALPPIAAVKLLGVHTDSELTGIMLFFWLGCLLGFVVGKRVGKREGEREARLELDSRGYAN